MTLARWLRLAPLLMAVVVAVGARAQVAPKPVIAVGGPGGGGGGGGGSVTVNAPASGTEVVKNGTGSTFNQRGVVGGTGIICTQATDTITCTIDDAIVAKWSVGTTAPSANCTAGAEIYTDTTAGRMYRCGPSNNTWTEVARISSGSGAPSSGSCDAAAEAGTIYYRTDNTSGAGGHYGCAQTGSGTYAWVLLSGSGGLTAADASGVNTGTSTTTAVTPDALAGSVFGEVVMQALVTADFTTDTATGDGKFYFVVPAKANGMNLVSVHAQVITAGTTNTTDVQIARCATAASGNACSGTVSDMLTTKLTIDSGENSSATAATAAVINTSNDDVATNQILRVDVDAVSTTAAKGLIVTLVFQLP